MSNKFVFKLLEQPTEDSKYDLDDEYIGTYVSNTITRDLLVEIVSNTSGTMTEKFQVPLSKVEKLYQWK